MLLLEYELLTIISCKLAFLAAINTFQVLPVIYSDYMLHFWGLLFVFVVLALDNLDRCGRCGHRGVLLLRDFV